MDLENQPFGNRASVIDLDLVKLIGLQLTPLWWIGTLVCLQICAEDSYVMDLVNTNLYESPVTLWWIW